MRDNLAHGCCRLHQLSPPCGRCCLKRMQHYSLDEQDGQQAVHVTHLLSGATIHHWPLPPTADVDDPREWRLGRALAVPFEPRGEPAPGSSPEPGVLLMCTSTGTCTRIDLPRAAAVQDMEAPAVSWSRSGLLMVQQLTHGGVLAVFDSLGQPVTSATPPLVGGTAAHKLRVYWARAGTAAALIAAEELTRFWLWEVHVGSPRLCQLADDAYISRATWCPDSSKVLITDYAAAVMIWSPQGQMLYRTAPLNPFPSCPIWCSQDRVASFEGYREDSEGEEDEEYHRRSGFTTLHLHAVGDGHFQQSRSISQQGSFFTWTIARDPTGCMLAAGVFHYQAGARRHELLVADLNGSILHRVTLPFQLYDLQWGRSGGIILGWDKDRLRYILLDFS